MKPWEEIEKEPEFSLLEPQDRVQVFDAWKDQVLSAATDADPENIDPVGINRFVAISNARRRSLETGEPFDEQSALTTYNEAAKGYAADRVRLLQQANDLDTAEFELKDRLMQRGATKEPFDRSFGPMAERAREILDKPVREAESKIQGIQGLFKTPEQVQEARQANQALRGERPTAVLDGELIVDPSLTLNSKDYREAVVKSDASPEAKARALSAFADNKAKFLEASKRTLAVAGESPIPGMTSFPEWESKLPKEKYLLPQDQKVAEYMREMKDRPWFSKFISSVATGLLQGGTDVASQGIGVAAMASGSPELAKEAATVAEGAELLGQVQKLEGDKEALGAETAGGVARMAVPIAPAILGAAVTGGGLPAAAAMSGLQTAGSQFPSTYQSLVKKGVEPEEALKSARGSAIISGAITAGITALGGKTGVEGLLREQGSQVVKNRLLSAIKSIPLGAVKEIPEELSDELLTQIVGESTANPDKPVSQIVDEFMAQAPEMALQVGILGAAGETIGALRGNEQVPSPPAPVQAGPAEGGEVVPEPPVPEEVTSGLTDEERAAMGFETPQAAAEAPQVEAQTREKTIQSRLSEIEKQFGPRDEVTFDKDGKPKTKPYRPLTTEERSLLDELEQIQAAAEAPQVEAPAAEEITPDLPPVSLSEQDRSRLQKQWQSLEDLRLRMVEAGNVEPERVEAVEREQEYISRLTKPVEPTPDLPPVANDTAIAAFENVEANADVAPATAAALEEITSEETPVPPVTTQEQETPVAPAESDGGSLGSSQTVAEGSIPAVTESTVPQEPVVSSGEIEPARPPASEQTFVETPDKKWGWEVTDQLGGEAYGSIVDGTADIIGMRSAPVSKAYTEEGERLKRRGFLRALINTLRSKGANRLKVGMQSADTRKALARLVETGELTNPREMRGISVDEHPTLFDISQPASAQADLGAGAATTPQGAIESLTAPLAGTPVSQQPQPAKRPRRKTRPTAQAVTENIEITDEATVEPEVKPLTRPLRPKFEARETVALNVREYEQSVWNPMTKSVQPLGYEQGGSDFSLATDDRGNVFVSPKSGRSVTVHTPQGASVEVGLDTNSRPYVAVEGTATQLGDFGGFQQGGQFFLNVEKAARTIQEKLGSAAPSIVRQLTGQSIKETPAAPTALARPLRPKFEAGETVAFKHPSGQMVVGTVQRVSGGGSATVSYNWNGKKEQEVVLRTTELSRPAQALADAPSYELTQEQNAKKARSIGLPTEPGVTVDAEKVIQGSLDKIASDTKAPTFLRAVARALQKQSFKGVDLRIEADGRRWYAGYYLNDQGITEIGLNLRNVGRGDVDVVNVFLHEALHHATIAKVRNPQEGLETEAVQALDTLRKRVKAYAGMKQKATKFSYELGNVEEFITAVFTRPDFQNFLASIPDTFAPDTPASKFRSVLSEVFRIIAQLVTGQKVQKGGTLEQAITSTLVLFETPQREVEGRVKEFAPAEQTFYSKLAQVIEQKMPNRADVATIKGIITNPQTGIKQEELKWSGILPWLEEQARRAEGEGQRVSKQAVLDYLASDGAVVLEEVRGGVQDRGARSQAKLNDVALSKFGKYYGDLSDEEASQVEAEVPLETYTSPTKFAQYQLPGGENYREVVLAMPDRATKAKRFYNEIAADVRQFTGSQREDALRRLLLEAPLTPADQQQAAEARRILQEQNAALLAEFEASFAPKNKDAAHRDAYRSRHFPDVPNYVAHARLNDRVDAEGRPGTFIEEIQSDRHQAGREKGYIGDEMGVIVSPSLGGSGWTAFDFRGGERINMLDDVGGYYPRKEYVETFLKQQGVEYLVMDETPTISDIPDAPFRTTWPLQMFKRALADAVAAGKQWIGWTTGDTQAERYDLSKQVDKIEVYPLEKSPGMVAITAYKDGRQAIRQDVARGNMADLIGKEAAQKAEQQLQQNNFATLEGDGLKVGGEGMKGFYDTILPKEIGKYVKQWGAGVVKDVIETTPDRTSNYTIRDRTAAGEGWHVMNQDGALIRTLPSKEEAERWIKTKRGTNPTPIWRVDITPQMKSSVESGQALFSVASATAQPEIPTLNETQVREILTQRFGAKVAEKIIVGNFPAMPLVEGGEPLEVDAFLKGGKIHLNLKFIDSPEFLVSKAEHEMAHAVWKNPNVQAAWKDLTDSMPAQTRERITTRIKELGYDTSLVDEEVMVRFFEEVRAATPPQKWKAFMDAVIDALRRFLGMAPDERTARLAAARIIAEAESAVARGLDPLQAAFGMSIPRAVIEKLDADYLAAVEAGDMEKAQRMVDEAAKAAGYNVGPVYHHGGFDIRENAVPNVSRGFHLGTRQAAEERAFGKPVDDFIADAEITFDEDLGAWFWSSQGTDSYDVVDEEGFSSEASARRSLEEFASQEDFSGFEVEDLGNLTAAYLRVNNPLVTSDQKADWDSTIKRAVAGDYDAVQYRNDFEDKGSTSYIALQEGQIKSADPVTYDDQGNVIPLSKRFNLTSPDIRYSARYQQDLKSREWETTPSAKGLFEKTPQQGTMNEASKIIGGFLKDGAEPFAARRKALNYFATEPGLRPEVRIAGLGLLAQQMDMVANMKGRAGQEQDANLYDDEVERAAAAKVILENDPNAWQNLKFDIDAALSEAARDAGLALNIINTLNRTTPEGFIRRMERRIKKQVDTAVAAETGGKTSDELYNEIARIWQLMREAGPGARGEAIAAALKAFMPKSVSIRNIIDSQPPKAGFREKMANEGEQLVRNFFQMIAGPRDPKGPLAEFNESVQGALSDMLRRVMKEKGLLKENQSVQMTDIDKLVRSVSADELRFQKIEAADAAMQDELDSIEDPERRATLQQAWDEAMAKMTTTVAPESVVRRAVNAELKELKTNWNELFDKGGTTNALRDKVVSSVMDKVTKKLNIEADQEPGGAGYKNLGMLQDEIKNAFDFVASVKKQEWLKYRESVELRKRLAEKRKDFLAALRNQKVAESTLSRLNEALAGPPKPGAPKNEVSELVSEHLKNPDPDFAAKLSKLGVNEETAKLLSEMIEKTRKDAAEAEPYLKAAKAVDEFIKSIGKTSTKRATEVLTPLAKKILQGATADALDRKEFQDALATAFNVPVMTAEQQAEFKSLLNRIRAIPEGVLQDDLKKELNAKLAMFDGIPAVDMLTSAWYSNILSGMPTLFLQVTGNAFNTAINSALTALTSNPKDTVQAVRGAFTSGLKQGLNEAMMALQGRSQFKPTATTDRNTISNLEILGKYGPQSWTDSLAYIASAGTLTKYVFRLFSAIDAFFQSTAREAHAYLAASRAARKVGKIGSPEYNAEFIKQLGGDTREFEAYLERAKEEQVKAGLPFDKGKVIQRAYELRAKDRPASINQLADRFANRITFTGKPEGIGKTISNVISGIQRITPAGFPLGRLLLPFNQIVSNIFEQSLDYFLPVGAGRALIGGHLSDIQWVRGRPRLREGAVRFDPIERRQRMAAALTGTVLGLIVYAIADKFKDEPDEDVPFMIYGQGPRNKARRDSLIAMGWSPNTIKIGDTFFKYSEYPLSMILSAVGAAMDAERYEKLDKKDSNDRMAYIIISSIRGMLNQGVLSSLSKVGDVMTGDASLSSLADIPVSATKGMVPASGLLKDVANIMDPNKVSADTLRAAFLRDIPVAKSYAGNYEINRFGEPVKLEGLPVLRRAMVGRVENHVSDWLGRNFLTVPEMDRTIEIGQYFPKEAKTWIQRKALQMGAAENGMFTQDQNFKFQERAGKLTKNAIERVMTLKKNPRPAEREALQKIINREVEAARKKAMMEIVREDYLK